MLKSSFTIHYELPKYFENIVLLIYSILPSLILILSKTIPSLFESNAHIVNTCKTRLLNLVVSLANDVLLNAGMIGTNPNLT
jgi:competence protein ComGC